MNLFKQASFLLLPSRFLLMGLAAYIGLELIGALLLQLLPAFEYKEQNIVISMRLLELAAFLILIKHFRMAENLGLVFPDLKAIRIFAFIAIGCTCVVMVLYTIEPSWFAYVMLPAWLHGVSGLLLMILLAPVVEELVFRGLVYRMLREQWGIAVSVVISSVFFSLLHQGLIVSPQLLGGIIFALAYEWSRSLWVSIGLHIGANSAVYLLSRLA